MRTTSLNVGIGPISISIQVSVSENGETWVGSATAGPGYGLSGSSYKTNTWATR